MHLLSKGFGRLFRGHPHCAAAVDVNKCRCHLAPVSEFECALAQAATRHHTNRVGRAAVNLNKGDQPLAVRASRIVDPQLLEAKHRHAYTENLPGTQMSVSLLGFPEIFIERFHCGCDASSSSVCSNSEACP